MKKNNYIQDIKHSKSLHAVLVARKVKNNTYEGCTVIMKGLDFENENGEFFACHCAFKGHIDVLGGVSEEELQGLFTIVDWIPSDKIRPLLHKISGLKPII